jgi:hypothetical protein
LPIDPDKREVAEKQRRAYAKGQGLRDIYTMVRKEICSNPTFAVGRLPMYKIDFQAIWGHYQDQDLKIPECQKAALRKH